MPPLMGNIRAVIGWRSQVASSVRRQSEDDEAFDVPLEVAEANRDRMREWLRRKRRRPEAPLIAIAPAAAYGPAKEWPLAYYAGLMESIGARYGAECVLIGAPNERVRCASIAGSVRTPAIVAAGETSIGELIGLLSLCAGFAGNDSGAMHLAAAIGIPAVGIFGSTNPARTGPQGAHAAVINHQLACSPCLARTCRYGHYDCLRGIEVAEAVTALERAGAFSRTLKTMPQRRAHVIIESYETMALQNCE